MSSLSPKLFTSLNRIQNRLPSSIKLHAKASQLTEQYHEENARKLE